MKKIISLKKAGVIKDKKESIKQQQDIKMKDKRILADRQRLTKSRK